MKELYLISTYLFKFVCLSSREKYKTESYYYLSWLDKLKCHWKKWEMKTRKRQGPARTPKTSNKMNCELMLTYDTPALRQTGRRNMMGPKRLPTIWGTYMKLVTKYQISAINSCCEKWDEKYLGTDGKTDGRTDRDKTVYPHTLRWSGGITTFISHKINKNKNPDNLHTGFAL